MAGFSCRDFLLRVAVVLLISVSVLSSIADPFSQVAVAADMDDMSKVAIAFTPDLDPDELNVPQIADRLPDFRLDDLRAERQASSHEWRVTSAFEARGPPV